MKSHIQITIFFVFSVFIYGIGNAQSKTDTLNLDSNTKDKNMIIGKTTLEILRQNTEFWDEYTAHYASYAADEKKINEISNILMNRNIHIISVIGTWCGDTKEQFPVLQKILNNLPISNLSIEYIGVNRDKLAGEVDISALNISFIPAFIFYENSKEIGRIVETPEDTMENHILKILNQH
jgi:thiol-disulfide isomerase/thioredoxin